MAATEKEQNKNSGPQGYQAQKSTAENSPKLATQLSSEHKPSASSTPKNTPAPRNNLNDNSVKQPSPQIGLRPQPQQAVAQEQQQSRQRLQNQNSQPSPTPELTQEEFLSNCQTIMNGLMDLFEEELKKRPKSVHQWRRTVPLMIIRAGEQLKNGSTPEIRAIQVALMKNCRANPSRISFAFTKLMLTIANQRLGQKERQEIERNLLYNQENDAATSNNLQNTGASANFQFTLSIANTKLAQQMLAILQEAATQEMNNLEDQTALDMANQAIDNEEEYDKKEDEEEQENLTHELQTEPTPTQSSENTNSNDANYNLLGPKPEAESESLFKEMLENKAEQNSLASEMFKEAVQEKVAEAAVTAVKASMGMG